MFFVIFKVRLIKFTSMGILGHFSPRFFDKNLHEVYNEIIVLSVARWNLRCKARHDTVS